MRKLPMTGEQIFHFRRNESCEPQFQGLVEIEVFRPFPVQDGISGAFALVSIVLLFLSERHTVV
jgi:hypothetical protein